MDYSIAVFGAFDINSLGDMLFTKALEVELGKRLALRNIIFFSPTDTRSEYYSNYEIYPYEKFEEINSIYHFQAIIIGGGELLHYREITFANLQGHTISYQDGRIWRYPVEMGKKYAIKVLINSVGMPHDLSFNDRELLASLDYISFRDRYSAYRFYGVQEAPYHYIVPDSLWNLDEYFPILTNGKADRYSREIIGIREEVGYVALQLGTLDYWQDIFECILGYCHEKGLKLVVFAINWCHDDKAVIEKLAESKHRDCYIMTRLLEIEEIIAIISGSNTLVTTSFHGTLIGCLARVRTITYNIYSYFVSKMDGIADWLGKRDFLVDDLAQLKEALWHMPVQYSEFPVSGIKYALAAHFDRMAQVISGTAKEADGSNAICPSRTAVHFDRSFLEWNRNDGTMGWRAIISTSATDTYEINEYVEHANMLSWIFKSMDFASIHVDFPQMTSADVDEKGRCYERTTRFIIDNAGENIHIRYQKSTKEKDEDYKELLQKYWNKSAHVELLEMQEREYLKEFTQIRQLQNEVEKDSQHYSVLESKIAKYEKEIQDLRQIIRNKEGHIQLLLEVEREYEREKHSRTYRMALIFRRISTFFLPAGSKRRFFFKLLVKGLRHPIRMIRMVNLRRIKNCFTILKTEGTDSAANHLNLVEEFERSESVDTTLAKLELMSVIEEPKELEVFQPISFTLPADPVVSIVIPVYNQFGHTYCCLESIKRHSGTVPYEILLADDCSTDLTKDIGKIVTGIRIIRNKANLRFLLNCNNAAAQARGKYILFLNNDTQVQENWLQPLVDLMESDASIGLTGSKLLYPDGHLQEAGGIFWKDASAWNYGHLRNPEDPEYNYVRETDYISGASIMIRKSLWEEIGGFDKRFSPAYYEDSDLAFEVRKHGYKVVYQPLSVVVHFEGISNGKDITTGQKSYQVVNQQKFYNKWKDVLEKEHFPNGENMLLARDRSSNKKRIVVVDHYVPHYDKDAGGKCTYMYLLLFVKMGLKVTFIGDNFYKHEPYTTDLNQHGIEVLYGNYYFNHWKEWLKENLHYFDYVYLQRPHIASKYMDVVKQYSHAKVFYFAHDLHHVREYREYLLTQDEEKLKSSERWKEIEYDLFEKADVGHVVGSYEQSIMQKAFPGKPIRNIPLYIYEDMPADINKDFKSRHDLVYVGGFGHPPNIDAVLWFGKEVFPKVLAKYPDMKWHVVGGKVPAEIQALASDNIRIEGFLPDEELHKLYRECRMAIVPLRFGAGVKGKVVEAAYWQIPLITTAIGAEGLDADMGNMAIEDEPDKMAELICGLYEDYERLHGMSDAGKAFVRKFFTVEEAERILNKDL